MYHQMQKREEGKRFHHERGRSAPVFHPESSFFLYGIHPVREALQAPNPRVECLYVAQGRRGHGIAELVAVAESLGIKIHWKDRKALDQICGVSTHQGVVGVVSPPRLVDLEEILQRCKSIPKPIVLALDGIKDPRNLGSLLRSAEAFGVSGVLIPKDRAAGLTPTVAKTSAGAVEYTPVVQVVNLVRALRELKAYGFWIIGAEAQGGKPCFTHHFQEPTALVLGEESRGLRPLVRQQCDFLLTIPLRGRIQSLNVAVAGGIFLYEIRKQQEACVDRSLTKK